MFGDVRNCDQTVLISGGIRSTSIVQLLAVKKKRRGRSNVQPSLKHVIFCFTEISLDKLDDQRRE